MQNVFLRQARRSPCSHCPSRTLGNRQLFYVPEISTSTDEMSALKSRKNFLRLPVSNMCPPLELDPSPKVRIFKPEVPLALLYETENKTFTGRRCLGSRGWVHRQHPFHNDKVRRGILGADFALLREIVSALSTLTRPCITNAYLMSVSSIAVSARWTRWETRMPQKTNDAEDRFNKRLLQSSRNGIWFPITLEQEWYRKPLVEHAYGCWHEPQSVALMLVEMQW